MSGQIETKRGARAQRNKALALAAITGALALAVIAAAVWRAPAPEEAPLGVQRPTQDSTSPKDAEAQDDSQPIVADNVDTTSKYSLAPISALAGTDNATGKAAAAFAWTFTNNSDSRISFDVALSVRAVQDGRELTGVYLPQASEANGAEIEPKSSATVCKAFRLQSTSPITLTVIDRTHYARKVVFMRTYTLGELLANTEAFLASEGGAKAPLSA